MNIEKISGGSARLAQLMLLLVFLPLVSYLTYIILAKKNSLEGSVFLLIFIAAVYLALRNGFSYADLYLSNHCLILKKLFITKSKLREEIKQVDKAILPFTFYVEFSDNTKAFFFSRTSELFKQLISSDPDKGVKIVKETLSKSDFKSY